MAFGNILGPIYPLGKIIVATAGTPVTMDQNVPIKTAFGTAGSNAYGTINQLIITTPSTNTGLTYLVFKGGNKNSTNGTAVIVAIPAGSLFVLAATQMSNMFALDQVALDADTNANAAFITAVIS